MHKQATKERQDVVKAEDGYVKAQGWRGAAERALPLPNPDSSDSARVQARPLSSPLKTAQIVTHLGLRSRGRGAPASGRWSLLRLSVPLVAVELDLTLTLQVTGVAAVW